MVSEFANEAPDDPTFRPGMVEIAKPSSSLLARSLRGVAAYPLQTIIVTVFAFVLFLFILASFPKTYSAAALITPPSELDRLNVQSGLSGGMASGSSALAGLAGLGGGPQSATQTRYETFVTLLTSRRIAAAMIRDHDALHVLYAKQWDKDAGRWKQPTGLLSRARSRFSELMGFPGWTPPDANSLAKYMDAHLKVTQSLKTTQRTLTLTSKSPELASELLTWAMEESDEAVRTDALARANEQLRYLNAQISQNIANSENRTILSEILMGTERSVFLASTGSTFAEQIIQPAETSKTPSSPKLIPSVALCLVAAFAVAVAAAVYRIGR